MKRALETLVILRFPTSSPALLVSSLERCLDALPEEELHPLHWSLPLGPLLGGATSRAEKVLERLRARTSDRLIPAGFSGAYHPLLDIEELKNEVEWSRSNPWGEDASSLAALGARDLFPASVDLLREAALRVYRAAGRVLITPPSGDRLFLLDGESCRVVRAVVAGSLDRRQLSRRLLRAYRRDGDDRLAVVVNGVANDAAMLRGLMTAIVEARRGRAGFEIVAFDRLATELPADTIVPEKLLPSLPAIPTDPVSRLYRATASHMTRTKNRGADELTRRRLERLAAGDFDEAKRVARTGSRPAVDNRSIVADMFGEVSLTESELVVSFVEGRITGMRRRACDVLAGAPAASRIVCGGRSLLFSTVGSYSFEENSCRGLRTILRLAGEPVATPGELIIDYGFEEGRDDLQVTVNVTYPELKNVDWVEEYAPVEIPLFALDDGESIELRGEYRDGERYELRLNPSTEPLQVFGNLFRFTSRSGTFQLAFPAQEASLPEVLPLRFRPRDRGYLFCINPRGSYTRSPAAAFTGVAERFQLSMNAEAPAVGANDRKSLPTREKY